jgi:UDP-N-acetylglucosamine transferase subunit ALG13
MIFVTVGTHEQQFDRLVKAVDKLVAEHTLDEPVFIQTGYCAYEPMHCEWASFVPAQRMTELIQQSDVVVTHGGPSSFLEAMAAGKVPVVVPRRSGFNEHINDHQLDFVRLVAECQGGIIPVYDTDQLFLALQQARLSTTGEAFKSHNREFCAELCRLVLEL